MDESLQTNGPGGPFTGQEVRAALESLGWTLIEEPEEDEAAGFEHPEIDSLVWIDLGATAIYYADPFFERTAKTMVDSRVTGKLRREAIEHARRSLKNRIRLHRTQAPDEPRRG